MMMSGVQGSCDTICTFYLQNLAPLLLPDPVELCYSGRAAYDNFTSSFPLSLAPFPMPEIMRTLMARRVAALPTKFSRPSPAPLSLSSFVGSSNLLSTFLCVASSVRAQSLPPSLSQRRGRLQKGQFLPISVAAAAAAAADKKRFRRPFAFGNRFNHGAFPGAARRNVWWTNK